MRIMFSGGGTMGSVSPLVAIIEELLSKNKVQPNAIVWVGTYSGPERKLMAKYDIQYEAIPAGKLRRYFSWQNFVDPFKIIAGFFLSYNLMTKYRPDIVISAGGFVSVPLAFAAKLYGSKIMIHQLDLDPGLANKIMARVADVVTVSWQDLVSKFKKNNAVWVGTPIRRKILQPITSILDPRLEIHEDRPLILVMGGGTGALEINRLVSKLLPELLDQYQVVHLTGPDKMIGVELPDKEAKYYQAFDYIDEELGYLMNMANVIISRAGIGSLTEIFAINKPAIIIPMPKSHQEINAKYFETKGAIKIVEQGDNAAAELLKTIEDIINQSDINSALLEESNTFVNKNATQAFVAEIYKLLEK